MNINKYLPIEIVNKILIMRPSHIISLILKSLINSYIGSNDNDDYYFSFLCIVLIKYLMINYIIMLTNKTFFIL